MSRRLFRVLALAALTACMPKPEPAGRTTGAVAPTPGPIDLAAARRTFDEIAAVTRADAGKLWGKSLAGPMLFVDRESRQVVANEADGAGRLRAQDGVFVGSWPADQGIANTAIEWQGKRWTMVGWDALGEDRASRVSLLAHESFHRLQPALGLEVGGDLNVHLDEEAGRVWLELEWRALDAALESKAAPRAEALADALGFRAARRAAFATAAERETALEIHEGLAEYTGARLGGLSASEVVKDGRRRRAREKGFVRGFAYVSGPLYGFLLDETGAGWRRRVTKTTDLGALLGEAAGVRSAPLAEVDRRAERYGGSALRSSEAQRGRERAAKIGAWRAALVDGPVLVLDRTTVESMMFDPTTVFPIGDDATVYVGMALLGKWGRLEVSDDAEAWVDNPRHEVHVSLAGADPGMRKGRGWSLELSPGWKTAPGSRPGDVVILRQ